VRKIVPILLLIVLAGAIAVTIIYITRPTEAGEGIMIRESPDSLKKEKPVIRAYGLPVDSFYTVSGTVKRDQTLSIILNEFGVDGRTIHNLAAASKDVFDLRKIRQGKPYQLFCSRDSLHTIQYMVYEHTPVDYIMFNLRDSLCVERHEKEIIVRTKQASGVIESSLWNSMLDIDLEPMLAFELSEIYAWTIDFFGLQAGDRFSVDFDEQYVDSTYIGLGRIHGAYFLHANHEFYAIPFIQDGVESFFDQEGNSLRKAFLKAPLRYSRISSRYSHSRLHPILKIRRPHLGVDYAAPIGTPVLAIGDGKVIKTGYSKGNGNMIKIQHNSVYATAYLHLSRYGKGVKTGAYVKQGDIIGYVGSTGLSTGPHLDFRFYKNGYPVDPLKVEAPPVEPVKKENLMAYDSIRVLTIRKLDHISFPDSVVQAASPALAGAPQ
jgi:murein DD-endopeptidase MepM/ murein hydrolase activator NlpD